MSSHEVNEKKYKLHVQPEDCVMDHKYSIFEDGEIVVMMNTLERHKDKPKELVEKLNAYPDLVAENERLRGALREAKEAFGKCNDKFWEIKNDFQDPREECRQGAKLSADAEKAIDAALSTEPARRG